MSHITAFVQAFAATLEPAVRYEFGQLEQSMLVRSMLHCGLDRYPEVTGDPDGERTSGDMICEACGHEYFAHPMDWRVIGYGNVPFLNVLCDGRRVKL